MSSRTLGEPLTCSTCGRLFWDYLRQLPEILCAMGEGRVIGRNFGRWGRLPTLVES